MANVISTPIVATTSTGLIIAYAADIISFCTEQALSIATVYDAIQSGTPIQAPAIATVPVYHNRCLIL